MPTSQMFAFDEETRSATTALPIRQPAPRSWASLASGKSSPAPPRAVAAPTTTAAPTLQTQNFPALGATSRPVTPLKTDVLAAPVPRWGTAKGGLAQLLAGSAASSRVPSRAPSDAGDIASERAGTVVASASSAQKKKKKGKKGKGAGAKGAGVSTQGLERPEFLLSKAVKKAVADQKLQPPTSSEADEEEGEDWKFLKKEVLPTPARSQSPSPPQSGLSSLLSQPHPADVVQMDSSATSDDECHTPVVAYEVPIKEDYVSRDVDSRPPSRLDKDPHRKMTADDFEQLKYLGKGAFGSVMLVRHKGSGKLYAQKQLKKATLIVHKRVVEQTRTERSILESVRHDNIVKLYYAFQDHEKLYLILQYAEGGEIFHHLSQNCMFPEDQVSFYIAQLVLALSHLHQNVGVVYRDLKPENCLLDADGHLLLTDFGLSKVRTDDERCNSYVGTPQYMAPEVLCADGTKEYGPEVDWWGVGILAHELLTGDVPFRGNTPEKVEAAIQKRKLVLPPYLSMDAKDFISRLLRKQPDKRLGYDIKRDLPVIKQHRFFRKIDWKKLERRELEPPIKPLVTDPELAENFSEEFTELPLSPVVERGIWMKREKEVNPFGGFSFVATSLLEGNGFRKEGWGEES